MTVWFSIATLKRLRQAQRQRWTMAGICRAFPLISRDQLVEGLDALRRFTNDDEAYAWLQRVLNCQMACTPLINGQPFTHVERDHRSPMF